MVSAESAEMGTPHTNRGLLGAAAMPYSMPSPVGRHLRHGIHGAVFVESEAY